MFPGGWQEGRVPGGRECGDTGLGVRYTLQWAAIHREGREAVSKAPGDTEEVEITRGLQHLELVNTNHLSWLRLQDHRAQGRVHLPTSHSFPVYMAGPCRSN